MGPRNTNKTAGNAGCLVLSLSLFGRIRQQRDLSRSLNCDGQHALILGRRASHPTGKNLPAFADEFLQGLNIFIIDVSDFIYREVAHFASLVATALASAEFLLAALVAGIVSRSHAHRSVSILSPKTLDHLSLERQIVVGNIDRPAVIDERILVDVSC